VGHRAANAFESLKSYLEKLPTFSSLEHGQLVILYVSATHTAISGALMVEKEIVGNVKATKQQFQMYYVWEVLIGS
jgi:hypothetical protein